MGTKEPSQSVMIGLGERPCVRRSLIGERRAAFVSHHLVEAPDAIAALRLGLKATRVVGAEFVCPASDRFARRVNAALKQHFFDQTQA